MWLVSAFEVVEVAGWSREEVRRTLKIRAGVLAEDPLAAYYDCRPWEPWAPGVACERFMRELERLALAVRTTD